VKCHRYADAMGLGTRELACPFCASPCSQDVAIWVFCQPTMSPDGFKIIDSDELRATMDELITDISGILVSRAARARSRVSGGGGVGADGVS
jgi:hypothetical protein